MHVVHGFAGRAKQCETAMQNDLSQNSCCGDNADGDNNDNGGADAAGINMTMMGLMQPVQT